KHVGVAPVAEAGGLLQVVERPGPAALQPDPAADEVGAGVAGFVCRPAMHDVNYISLGLAQLPFVQRQKSAQSERRAESRTLGRTLGECLVHELLDVVARPARP